jgi:hypothetical protein
MKNPDHALLPGQGSSRSPIEFDRENIKRRSRDSVELKGKDRS